MRRDGYAARKGAAALDVTWDLSRAEKRTSDELYAQYAEASEAPGKQVEKTGDTAAALKGAAKKLEAVYQFPYLAHAPMEPLDAVIEMNGDRLDVWMGSQFQVGELRAICATLGVPFEKASLHEQFAGGSFGRRATPAMEFAVEAAAAFKAWGKGPVKHVWTRENDIRGGRYRPLAVHTIRGGLDPAGKIVALGPGRRRAELLQELADGGDGHQERHRRRADRGHRRELQIRQPICRPAHHGRRRADLVVAIGGQHAHGLCGRDLYRRAARDGRQGSGRGAAGADGGSRGSRPCSPRRPRSPAGAAKPPAGRARGVAAWKSFGILCRAGRRSVEGRRRIAQGAQGVGARWIAGSR